MNNKNENYDLKTLKERLHSAADEKGYSLADVSRKTGISYKTVYKHHDMNNDDESMNIPSLIKYCNLYGCDMDYLFGKLDNKTHDLQFICDYTGLSEKAVKTLHGNGDGQFISNLFEYDIIDLLSEYITAFCISEISFSHPSYSDKYDDPELKELDQELIDLYQSAFGKSPSEIFADSINKVSEPYFHVSMNHNNLKFSFFDDENNRFFINNNVEITNELIRQSTINKLRQQLDKMIDDLYVF